MINLPLISASKTATVGVNSAKRDLPLQTKTTIAHIFSYRKFVFLFCIIATILALAYLVFNKFNKDNSLSEKRQFINLVSSDLIASDQSLEDIVQSLDLINSNYDKISSNEANLQPADYTLIISDNQKSLSQIESIKTNTKLQKESISQTKTPQEYEDLKINLVDYYNQTDRLLESLINDFNFESNMLKILSMNEIQNSTVINNVWKKQSSEEIIAFYKNLKNKAIGSLNELSKIKISEKYRNYYNLQINYFQLISTTSDEIINILNEVETQPLTQDEPSQMEKAYQVSFKSQNSLVNLNDQIMSEKQHLLTLKIDREDFNNLISVQKSIETDIKKLNQKLYQETQNNSKSIF